MDNLAPKIGALLIGLVFLVLPKEILAQCSSETIITTCAVERIISGCGTSDITGPVFSTTSATSSETEFENGTNQGVLLGTCTITSVTYIDVANGSCPIVVTRTWTVSDGTFSATCNQTINVDDNTIPTFTGSITTTNVEGCAVGDAPSAVTSVTALEGLTGDLLISDNCTTDPNLVVSSSQSSTGTCPIVITRTYKVTDACLNTSQDIIHTININDTTAPSVTRPNDVTVSCTTAIPAAATNITGYLALAGTAASDNCTAEGSLGVSPSTGSLVGTQCNGTVTRTYTISDACGNTSTATQVFTIVDNVNPDVTSPTATELECSSALPAAATTITEYLTLDGSAATDCSTMSVASNTGSLTGNECSGSITRTYTITDACGNSSTGTHIFNISDNTVPTWTTGANALNTSVECSDAAGLTAAQALFPIASDNCDSDVSDIVKTPGSFVPGGGCSQEGTYTNTWVVTDACGNTSAVFTQVITITDDTAPAVTGSITTTNVEGCVVGDAPGAVTTVAALEALTGNLQISDNCHADADLVVSNSQTTNGTCPIVITRTYKVTDPCGNTSVDVVHTINVVYSGGLNAPANGSSTVSCPADAINPGAPADITDACGRTVSAVLVGTGVSTPDPLTCEGTVVWTYRYTACDGETTDDWTYTYTIHDTIPPVLVGTIAMTNVEGCTVSAAPEAEMTVAGLEALGLTITDDCTSDANLVVTHVDVPTSSCPLVITRTYSVTDACDNTTTAVHTINVDDNTAPIVTGTIDLTTIEGCVPGDAPAPQTTVAGLENLAGDLEIEDACTPDANLTVTHTDDVTGTCPIVITRTYTVTDACLNASVAIVHTIHVDDNTIPVVTPPTAVELECTTGIPSAVETIADYLLLAGTAASDNCTATDNLTVTSETAALVGSECSGTITRTYTITDACGNATTANHIFNISDNTPPTASTPAPLNVQCIADVPIPNPSIVTTEADNCDASPTVIHQGDSFNGGSGCAASPYIVTRTYRVSDDCGNTFEVTQIITVVDDTAPVVTAPTATELECSNTIPAAATTIAQYLALTGANATDNCTTQGNLAVSSITGSLVGLECTGTITRTYTITDACGNTSTADHVFNVSDNTPPTATDPEPISVQCIADVPLPDISLVTSEADNCAASPSVIHQGDANNGGAGCASSPYIVTRTYRITDDCGNTTDVTQMITAIDTEVPTFTVPSNITINSAPDCSFEAPPATTGDVTDEADNCDITLDATYSDVVNNGACEGQKVVTRSWTLTDDCGNATTQTQIITVNDVNPPTLTAPTSTEIECNTAIPAAATTINDFLALPGAGATDACAAQANLTVTSSTGSLAGTNCNGTITRTYTITDPCGNASMVNHVFNVSDDTAPVVTPGTLLDCYQSVALAEAAAIVATTATDNCTGTLTYTATTTEGVSCDSMITVTVTDECGNSNTASYEVRINCQSVQVKVWLEGPYNTTTNVMSTALNNDHLLPGQNTTLPFVGDTPLGQPYSEPPWNYTGNSGMNYGDPPYGTIAYPTDVVDWILVTVRKNGILPADNIWTCAGWVHSDGNVTFPESCPLPAIEITEDYYILVQHRNHLGILSPSFVDIECDGAVLRWDFTTEDSYKPPFRVGQKLLESGVWGMFGSNGEQVNSIATISSPDRTRWRSQQGITGYLKGDYDLNRSANSADETKWKINQNKTSGVEFY